MTDGLEDRIASFMREASTEITPSEQSRLPELKAILPAGTAVYVAHTPKAGFSQVIQTALAVQLAGFQARPHIAARRIPNSGLLRAALAELHAGGVGHILLIAGDAPQPIGEFRSTLDVFASGVLEESGITRIGVAGHPEGHNAVACSLLWKALEAKQAISARGPFSLNIVTQFGLDGGAFRSWESELVRRGIEMPVRIGIAGPAPLAKLVHFAVQCGIGTSMRALMGNLSAAAQASDLLTSPDRHLLTLLATPVSAQIVAPHFFAFGGVLQTARWMRKVAAGSFDIDANRRRFKVR
ncbi:MAG TPA: methylenetetrahydrofolate reductase [Steroidobacteraceae bacterium]|jgi:methylenetetrahydrofolate reductase (NADPH)|nr:methylenetetrahydrofolate reductase [Steroidobacteraceae bacterium]